MSSRKMKCVRMERYNEVIIFPDVIEHSKFSNFKLVSAGFCYIDSDKSKISCFGESVSLNLKSKEDDSEWATRHFFYDF